MQTVRLSATAAAKFKAADATGATFKKSEIKKARDISRRHRGELVRIVDPADQILAEVQEPKAR
jgi:hypothetical protein